MPDKRFDTRPKGQTVVRGHTRLQNGKIVNVQEHVRKLSNWLDEEFRTKHDSRWRVQAEGESDPRGEVVLTTTLSGIEEETFTQQDADAFEHKSREYAAQLFGTAEVVDSYSDRDSYIIEIAGGFKD